MATPHCIKYIAITICYTLVGLIATSMNSPAGGLSAPVNKDEYGVAIKGYDAVAYFEDGHAEKGNPAYEYVWQDARWYFTSAGHRDQFAAAPERYAPAYGGFCATGMAAGMLVGVDPEAFKIIDGKLYLNYNHSTQVEFEASAAANIQKANMNWARKSKAAAQ
jgi:hypothetical protein